MIARYASSITTGTAVTFGLFYLMQSLIAMQPGIITDPVSRIPISFLPPDRERPVEVDDLLPDNDFIEPPTPPTSRVENVEPSSRGRPRPGTHVTPGPRLNNIVFRMTDGPLVTVMRVRPNYPPPMSQKGIEGYVVVRFDVMTDGSVENVSIVESSHRGFERNALLAAKRFRYKARVVDGVPQVTTGVRYLFRFEMNE